VQRTEWVSAVTETAFKRLFDRKPKIARGMGYCTRLEDGEVRITFYKRLLSLPRENVLGVVRHELGHACDKDFDEPDCEQRADDVAEKFTGEKIRYDCDEIQTVGKGKYPRPGHLPR